jgi:GNAT superfamily N-acetyltransferase
MQIRTIESEPDVQRCWSVMRQLRPHLSAESFAAQVRRQMQAHAYRLACVEAEGVVKAVAGFRVSECLAWGRFLYVDDLVTDETERSRGHGEALLRWLIERAWSEGCDELHLDSGVTRFGAHRFYLRHGMRIASHHFSLRRAEARVT